MNIALFGRGVSPENIKYVQRVIDKLTLEKCKLYLYKPLFEMTRIHLEFNSTFEVFENYEDIYKKVEAMFSIGGDGTMLDAMTFVRDSGIPIMGINIGRLGFLSSISKDEIYASIETVIRKDYRLDSRTLIRIERPSEIFGELNYALNDLTITRKDSTSLIVLHVYVDDIFLNTYWADGLIVATPTGSTAYSLSCGGPILTPGSENFVITPIAPHNLTVRPFVIPDKSKIRIIIDGRDDEYFVSLDSRRAIVHPNIELIVERAAFKINIIQMEGRDFFSTIREKLKWGLDFRN